MVGVGLGWPGLYGLGLGGYSWMTSGLIFLLTTPYWHTGIVPGLILKILLVKGSLILAPPIALGAFVIGQGSGLLIGKLLGVRLVLRNLRPRHYHRHYGFHKGWKPIYHAVGWRPWRLRLRLPFFRRFRLHRHYPPPPHFNFHVYPPIHHIKYTKRPYGTYNYAPESSSGWLPGPPPQSSSGFHGSTSYSDYAGEASHLYNGALSPNEYEPQSSSYSTSSTSSSEAGKYSSSDGGSDSGSNEHSDSGYSSHYGALSGSSQEYNRRKKELDGSPVASNDIENFIVTEVMKLKSGDFNLTSSEEEKKDFESIINEEFEKDLLMSIEQGTVPEFVPIPDGPLPDPFSLNATSTSESSNVTSTNTTAATPESSGIFTSVMNTIANMNPADYIPSSLISWLTGSDGKKDGKSEYLKSRQRRGTEAEANNVKTETIEISIVKDIRNLFSIVSFLDINRCLEKMVCEIHSRGRAFTGRQLTNSYEGTIIAAFRIMEKMMPDEKDESTVKYREAARLGAQHDTPAACLKNFPGCPISTDELIKLGNIISPQIPTSNNKP